MSLATRISALATRVGSEIAAMKKMFVDLPSGTLFTPASPFTVSVFRMVRNGRTLTMHVNLVGTATLTAASTTLGQITGYGVPAGAPTDVAMIGRSNSTIAIALDNSGTLYARIVGGGGSAEVDALRFTATIIVPAL